MVVKFNFEWFGCVSYDVLEFVMVVDENGVIFLFFVLVW